MMEDRPLAAGGQLETWLPVPVNSKAQPKCFNDNALLMCILCFLEMKNKVGGIHWIADSLSVHLLFWPLRVW